MKFKDNFNEILLIAEEPVLFYIDSPFLTKTLDFKMKLLNLKDILLNPYVQFTIALCNMPIQELQHNITTYKFNSLFELLTILLQNGGTDTISRSFQSTGRLIFNNFSIKDNQYYIKDFILDQDLFERIQLILLISSGLIKFGQTIQAQNIVKPQWLIEQEEKIRKIKNQNISESDNFKQISKVLIAINYELHYTFEELFNMNYYHINFLSTYVPKIVNYDIQKRQILAKKPPKYITEN